MIRRTALLAVAALGACSQPPRDAESFARAPEAAARVVADCDAGRTDRECDAARLGLAETRRRARMAAYAQTIREP
ncbi:hypothetical protein [Brevundimonas pondensis]|uniref:EexN family lipoprotein n=1 Tax=Brevundimonas pondensis TaxID=2774189 RepID=A0ABX7SL74_9CAUL|nr:hypothetical protein [Brevundimonas pondensis]QTC88432.1 hypothetical protein IFE19_03300 [Brevundimonas pondensis]